MSCIFCPFKKQIAKEVMKDINTTTGEINQSLLYVHQKKVAKRSVDEVW